MNIPVITENEFSDISRLLYEKTGIFLNDSKKYLVFNRLAKRLRELRVTTFKEYLKVVENDGPRELQVLIDQLTTNETFFFREQQHFDLLQELVKDEFYNNNRKIRVWSAASSSGEEVYSISMILADIQRQNDWYILGTDINTTVVKQAKLGKYPMKQANLIPEKYLKKYCLRGVRTNEGAFVINDSLKKNIKFDNLNLKHPLPDIGMFDVIFLRNTLIYFDNETKRKIIMNVLSKLKQNGYLFISHTESLLGLDVDLDLVKKKSSVYKKYKEL